MSWDYEQKRNLPLAIILGIIWVIIVFVVKPEVEHIPPAIEGQAAQYIPLPQSEVNPEISGFGIIQPNVNLSAISEVNGKVVYVNPKFKKGELFPKDTLLIKIDDSNYQLQVTKAEAEFEAARIKLTEKNITLKNNLTDLELSKTKLSLSETEYQRIQGLFNNKLVSTSDLDQAKQALLVQKQALQQIQHRQKLLPVEVTGLKAQLEIAKANLSQSYLDLKRTEIKLPFTGRINSVAIEKDQWVSQGTSLFNASDIQKIQINAQFPLSQFIRFTGLFSTVFSASQIGEKGIQSYLQDQELTAEVYLLGHKNASWTAKIERFSDEIDPQTQTAGVIVSVSESYDNIRLGQRPPLLSGMRAKVILRGKARTFVAIPRHLVNNDSILVSDKNSTLRHIFLANPLPQNNLVLSQDLSLAGAKLITSDLFPVIKGRVVTLSLDTVADEKLQSWLGNKL